MKDFDGILKNFQLYLIAIWDHQRLLNYRKKVDHICVLEVYWKKELHRTGFVAKKIITAPGICK